jgi:hypothetical protein
MVTIEEKAKINQGKGEIRKNRGICYSNTL